MKNYLSFAFLLLQSLSLIAQTSKSFNPQQTITADSARHSIKELLDEMAKKHPGFYRYTPKAEFNHFIDSSLSAIQGPMDELTYFRTLKPLIAKIRCVHTGVSLPEQYINFLNEQPNMLPLDVYFTDEKAYLIKNYSNNSAVPVGAELLSINGHPITAIKTQLFEMISSDGFNETWKYQAINNRFAQVYRTNYKVSDSFKIRVATNQGEKEFDLPAVRNDQIPVPAAMDLGKHPRLSFNKKDSVAILTIRSFGETDIKAGGQQFKKFIAGVFKELKAQHTGKLVIDLRNNTGGSDPNAALLCRYLIDRPFRYWDRIEVTEPFALSIKGSAKLVYGKPLKADSGYLWRKSKFTREFDFYEPQQPEDDVYRGKLVVLINGACLSSCADVAAVLQYNKRATMVGEETGGDYGGNNSGLIPEAQVAFGIKVSIPLLKYINAVDQNKNFGHGTTPDIIVEPSLSDILTGRDAVLAKVLQHLAN
ncbi:S41 family peptidase [Mucilaginibacter sp. RS28]|uniref:S41 family peptidase n=1 Tax=Mucilaginibacter straminoryzae TaxID=2932774 RepID=A0A9X2BDS8_9SPHI|nr:S41 family peptidase [Mucilaginibacter straminoryzae]MCJ8210648.1 S41 family peptidase [Mucilaginibacter straminoryzae]